jgi:hypothetical protein
VEESGIPLCNPASPGAILVEEMSEGAHARS